MKSKVYTTYESMKLEGRKGIMARILFVEDDRQYREDITNILEEGGHQVVALENPIDALDLFPEEHFDLVLADYMLDAMNGVQLIRYLKRLDTRIKTIILTGKDSPEIEISALENYVDQFLNKGLRGDLLLKYISRVLATPIKVFKTDDNGVLQSIRENITLNINSYEVYKNSQRVELTFKEFQLLTYFLKNMGKVLKREDIIEAVWGESKDEIASSRVVDSQVKLLRKKLKLKVIQSIRNVGYRWNE